MSEETQEKEYSAEDLKHLGAKWMERIRGAEKREDDWVKDAEEAEQKYLAEGENVPDFNIVHSNIETIVPALINSEPKPDIRPRHNAEDQEAKEICDILERGISLQSDDAALIREIEDATQDGMLAGRGVIRLRFNQDDDGSYQRVEFENHSWRDYREGPARRWKDVPWVGFRHFITNGDIDEMREFPKPEENQESTSEDDDSPIWEIWCKEDRKVYVVSEASEEVLSIKDDPLGLRKFFPMPEPIQPISATGKRAPVCPLRIYKALAGELDKITKRINKITGGLKVKGIIIGDAEDIEKFALADDNELIPVGNLEGLAATGGISKAIEWWPIEKAIQALQELYPARDAVKQAIYEVTGISDIVRGASDAAETATAQNIKSKWGSLRIKRMQQKVERQARDIFLLTAEIMWNLFSPQEIARAAGVEVTDNLLAAMQMPLDHFRIDVESDSTVRADLTEQKQEMSEFLGATGQFMQIAVPLAQTQPELAGALIEIYSSFARLFSLGKQSEDALDQMSQQARQQISQQDPARKAQEEQEAKDKEERVFALEVAEKEATVIHKNAQAAKLQADAQNDARQTDIKQDAQDLDEAKATVDGVFRLEETEIEKTQQRPAEI